MTLGQRIRAARKHAGLTQVQLAEAAGISQQTVSLLETDQQDESASVVAIARACNVNPFWLQLEEGHMLDPMLRTGEALRSTVVAMEPLDSRDQRAVAAIVQTYAAEATRKIANDD
jgi:transcriptional regulator with XRE-family HTH domain